MIAAATARGLRGRFERKPRQPPVEPAGEWRKPEAAREPEATAIFAELRLDDGERRDLFESARFRALLEAEPLARAA